MPRRSLTASELAYRKIEANVYFQIVRDLCTEMYNDAAVKAKCRADYLSIKSIFKKIDRRSIRNMGAEKYETGENVIADITDSVQENIDQCRQSLSEMLDGIIRADKVQFAINLGMISGFIDCIQHIYIYLKGRKSSEMDMIVTYLKHTERVVKVEAVECERQPDFARMQEDMKTLFKAVGEKCREELSKNR